MTLGPLLLMHPAVLLALPLVVYFFWSALKRPAPLPASLRWVAAGIRSGVFACLIVALAEPRLKVPSEEQYVIWLVDISASVGSAAQEKAKALAEEVGLPESRSRTLFFDGRVAGNFPPDGSGPMSSTAGTDIAHALRVAAASFPPGYSRTVVLLGDGRETDGDALEAAGELREAGVAVHTLAIDLPSAPEVSITGFHIPQEIRAGEPFVLRSEISSNVATPARIKVFHDGYQVGTRTIDLPKGSLSLDINQMLPPGRATTIALEVDADKDTWQENNRAQASVQVAGPARILVVSDDPPEAFLQALRAQGMEAEIRPPEGLPESPEGFVDFDAVVLDRVAADRIAAPGALVNAVESGGCGLLALGGPTAFGLGGYDRSPVGSSLPLFSESVRDKEIPSLAMALVIDRSGSMQGEKLEMAKQAAAAAIDLLGPGDFAGVVGFDDKASWSPSMRAAEPSEPLIEGIASLAAGGGTSIAAGLELAARDIRTVPARLKHVILLSDGISAPGPFEEIVGHLAADSVTLSTVGLGGEADLALLERLAQRGGGRFYFTDTPEAIPQIFARETMAALRPGFREEPFSVQPSQPARFLAGIEWESAPQLLGRVEVKARPGAGVWLETENGDPILATWQFGVGRTAAFASDARDVWARDWLGWEGFGAFWAQTLREIQRPTGTGDFSLEIKDEPERVVVTLEEPERGRFPTAAVRIEGDALGGELDLTGPGQYEVLLPDSETGALGIRVERDGLAPTLEYLSRTQKPPEEYLPGSPRSDTLEEIARATGGLVEPEAEAIREFQPPPRTVRLELWPWFALLAIGLFIGDVAIRRLKRG